VEHSSPPDYERLEALGVQILPWRRSGDHVLVCPPDEGFAALYGFNAAHWTESITQSLARLCSRPVKLRERNRAEATRLEQDLAGAWCLVTYVSNAAVEAVCAGIPVICTGSCAGAMMGARTLEAVANPPKPSGRRAWAARLAGNQWTMQEIAAGHAWKALGQRVS